MSKPSKIAIFLSSPTDVQPEREAAERVVARIHECCPGKFPQSSNESLNLVKKLVHRKWLDDVVVAVRSMHDLRSAGRDSVARIGISLVSGFERNIKPTE